MSDISRIALMLVISLMAGCADAPPPPAPIKITTDNYCRVTRPLTWSVKDSTATIDGVRKSNHVYTCTCARVKPKACKSSGG